MKYLFKKFFVIVASIYTVTALIPGITISEGINGILYASLILTILNYLLKPVLKIIFLPLNLVTFNLSMWIVESLIIYVWTVITPVVKISGQWQMIILVAVVITIIERIYKWLIY